MIKSVNWRSVEGAIKVASARGSLCWPRDDLIWMHLLSLHTSAYLPTITESHLRINKVMTTQKWTKNSPTSLADSIGLFSLWTSCKKIVNIVSSVGTRCGGRREEGCQQSSYRDGATGQSVDGRGHDSRSQGQNGLSSRCKHLHLDCCIATDGHLI